MKLAALILLLAIVGKISAHPLRVGYYRAIAPQQQHQQISSDEMDDEVPEDDDAETEVSEEDFTNDLQDDDDDDDDEQEPPPNFQKLFPVASPNQAGYNYPLSSMMGEIGSQAWRVPKKPANRGRAQLFRMDSEEDEEQADDDDDDDDDSDEEEDEEAEDDIPDWQALFPNQSEQGNGPPSDVIDQSSQPEIGAFRSGVQRPRIVYVPASQLQQGRAVYATPSYQPQYQRRQTYQGQYMMRNPAPPRAPVAYSYVPSTYGSRQQSMAMRRRPQTVMMASPSRRPQQQQQYYAYMPVRRNNYNPYVARWRRNSVPRISY